MTRLVVWLLTRRAAFGRRVWHDLGVKLRIIDHGTDL